eukprot:3553210-Amphidinium_carterae.1
MDALRRKNGAPLEMDMPDNVATGIAATGFGEVAGGDDAFQTLTDEKNNTSIIILKQRSLMQWIISRVLNVDSLEPDQRLKLIIHGPGGCGKSFVCKAAAHQLRRAKK